MTKKFDRSLKSSVGRKLEGLQIVEIFIQYLYISKGSSGECRSQTYRALDRKYITEEEHKELYSLLKNESQKIRAFIQYLKQSGYEGQKYK